MDPVKQWLKANNYLLGIVLGIVFIMMLLPSFAIVVLMISNMDLEALKIISGLLCLHTSLFLASYGLFNMNYYELTSSKLNRILKGYTVILVITVSISFLPGDSFSHFFFMAWILAIMFLYIIPGFITLRIGGIHDEAIENVGIAAFVILFVVYWVLVGFIIDFVPEMFIL